MNSKGLFYVLIAMSFCQGCIGPITSKPTQYLPQELKDYTDFKTGSYWVYQDSLNTSHVDSIVLIYHHQYIQPPMDGADGPGPSERFDDTLWSSLDGKFFATGFAGENLYHLQYPQWPNFETTYYIPQYGVIYDDWGDTRLTGAPMNLYTGKKVYHLVKEFAVDPTQGYKGVYPITDIWWGKNIGVIQKNVSGTTWQLVRYNVIQ